MEHEGWRMEDRRCMYEVQEDEAMKLHHESRDDDGQTLPGRMEMVVPGGEEVVEDKLLDILHIPPVPTIALLEQ